MMSSNSSETTYDHATKKIANQPSPPGNQSVDLRTTRNEPLEQAGTQKRVIAGVLPKTSFLITGASGFIGTNLAQYLASRGHQVRCLVRQTKIAQPLHGMDCEITQGDVLDEASLDRAVAGVDCVINLAAMTAALSREQLFQVNGSGAENVARACARQPSPPVLIHTSSIAAAGPTSRDTIRHEEDIPAPVSHYGMSKLAGEKKVRQWAGELPITIVRPGVVFGPWDRGMLQIARTIRQGRLHPVPSLYPPPLSMIHVEDLCLVLSLAAIYGERLPQTGSPPNEIVDKSAEIVQAAEVSSQDAAKGKGLYFAATAEYPDYADLGRMLRKLLNRPYAPIIRLPGLLPNWIAFANECIARINGRPTLVNRDKIREARVPSWACSHVKLNVQLGYAPAFSLQERLEHTIAWYREEKWL